MKDTMSYRKSEGISAATISSNTLATNTAPSFSNSYGRITTDIANFSDVGRSLMVQTDGKILLGGYAEIGSGTEFALVRYNNDGSLDTTFDGDGKLTTNFGGSYADAYSVMLQTDGKILMGGTNDGCGTEFALVRFNSDGSLDTTFSDDGKVNTNLNYSNNSARSIAVQTDGKILLGGDASDGCSAFFALVRYNNDGSLDTTFDGDGKLTTNFGGNYADAHSVTVQTDGKILLAGTTDNGCGNQFALVRYNNDGSLDTTFDGDGKLTTNFGGSSANAYSVMVQTDGKILLGGYADIGGGTEFALVRYNNNGSLDTTFDGDGKLTTNFGTNVAVMSSVTMQTDGKILLGGYAIDYSNGFCEADFALVRYNNNGSLDTTFDGDGKFTADFGNTYDIAMSVKVQADGKILLGGATVDFSNNYGGADFALVRYESNGSLDTTFGGGNSTLDGSPIWYGEDAVVLDNNIIISDAELSAADNFAGSTLTLERHGGANVNDVFSAIGMQNFSNEGVLSLVDSKVIVGETEIGTYTQSGGRFKINFNANATQELVNHTVQQIAYDNNSPVANGTANISWTFNDGSGASNAWVRGNTEVELSPDYSYGVVIDGKANVGQTLTAYNNIQSLDNVEPFGVDAPVLSYQWQANGINIRGATSSTYKLTTADFGKKIKVVVAEVGNNNPLQKFTSAETVAVGNVNKVGTGTVTVAGTPTQGETLTASSLLADLDNGVTPNNVSADVVFYQWKANGVIIAESSAANNDASLTLTQAQVGKRISVDAVYVDNLGNREVVSSRITAVVANVNDLPTGGINFSHHSDVPYVGQTLSFTNDIGDLDGLPTTIRYQWTADGVAIRGASSTSYVVREADFGKKIQVVATYTDLLGTAERVVSIETSEVSNNPIAPVNPPPMAFNGANALLLVDQILNVNEVPQALIFDNPNYQSYGETEMIGIKPWEFNIV